MTTAWSHLPNAKYIDLALESLKSHPLLWTDAWNKTYPNGPPAALDAALGAAWNATRNAVWVAAVDATWAAAVDATRDAILALIAYDDCGYMLESDVDELRILAAFGDPRAILLVPACLAFSMIKSQEFA